MKVELQQIPEGKKSILFHLLQLYMYDFSEIQGSDIGPDGLFRYEHLDSYWEDPSRLPFVISVDEQVAGFVLVNSYTCVQKAGATRSIAEFFVLRKYRRKGVGRTAAFLIFDRFPAKWEVRQIAENEAGQRFWRRVIGEYTGGGYEEVILDTEAWHGTAQIFDSGTARPERHRK